MKDTIVTAVSILLVVLLVVFLNVENSKSGELQQMKNEMEVRLNDYTLERKKLQLELESLSNQLEDDMLPTTNLMFVIKNLEDTYLENVLSEFNNRENKITGIYCLSIDMLPEENSPESLSTYNTLRELGWDFAMYWDGEGDFSEWYLDITRIMSEVGVAVPSVLYVDYSEFYEDLIYDAQTHGFEHLIIHRHFDDDEFEISDENINCITAYSWHSSLAINTISIATNLFSQIAFVLGDCEDQSRFNGEQFAAMMSRLYSREKSEKLIFASPNEAVENVLKEAEQDAQAPAVYETRRFEIEEKIEELDKKIDFIYEEYFGESEEE